MWKKWKSSSEHCSEQCEKYVWERERKGKWKRVESTHTYMYTTIDTTMSNANVLNALLVYCETCCASQQIQQKEKQQKATRKSLLLTSCWAIEEKARSEFELYIHSIGKILFRVFWRRWHVLLDLAFFYTTILWLSFVEHLTHFSVGCLFICLFDKLFQIHCTLTKYIDLKCWALCVICVCIERVYVFHGILML